MFCQGQPTLLRHVFWRNVLTHSNHDFALALASNKTIWGQKYQDQSCAPPYYQPRSEIIHPTATLTPPPRRQSARDSIRRTE